MGYIYMYPILGDSQGQELGQKAFLATSAKPQPSHRVPRLPSFPIILRQ